MGATGAKNGDGKKRTDGPDWLTLWAIGRYDLGLSEEEFWAVTYEEFSALVARDLERLDFLEHCGALGAWMTFNVNRAAKTPFKPVGDFTLRRNARVALYPARTERNGTVAASKPAQPVMRYAKPGERPPSKWTADTKDDLIERFDAWAGMRR